MKLQKNSGATLADVNHNNQDNAPPRRIIGDYALQQGPRYFSSIFIPNIARAIKMKPTHLTLISSHQFTGPYTLYPHSMS